LAPLWFRKKVTEEFMAAMKKAMRRVK
jgi:hypothetical protein